MKYIIMCGCQSDEVTPRHLIKINGEELAARTIRLLRDEGIREIYISTNHEAFFKFDVPIIKHFNGIYDHPGKYSYWVDGFFPMDEPVCYIFGDVYFSEEAIHTIVNKETDDIEFFASAPPFPPEYPKEWAEPFAFKVQNQEHFKAAIKETKYLCDTAQFKRHPIAWELWMVIKRTPLNVIDFNNYTIINDYTCDIDITEMDKYLDMEGSEND